MEVNSGRGPNRVWIDLAVALGILLSVSSLGVVLLQTHRGDGGLSSIACPNTFFARPLMIAAGRGAIQPDIDALPELKKFLDRRANSFDPTTLPESIPETTDSAAEYHIYLGWVVTQIWRMFGISWTVLEPFLALALGLSAVCAYGLFRLAMNRWISLACTALFATSPAVLDQVSNMRDFSKAPFLLAGMFAIGWVVTRDRPVRHILVGAAFAGAVAGVGMGFRQDALILMPASVAAILLLSACAVYGGGRRRVAAVLAYLLAFHAAAFPMFGRMEGGAQPYHPLAQGYSMKHMDRCSLTPGLCEPLANSHDNFVFVTVLCHARRAAGDERLYFGYNDPEDPKFTRSWVLGAGLQFPADTVARGYGATLNILAGADAQGAVLGYHDGVSARIVGAYRPVAAFFRVAGPPLALLALLAASAGGIRMGVTLLLMVLYFCGYVSLDNEWRHTFHLSFVPLWMAGFVLQQAVSAMRPSVWGRAAWGRWSGRAAVVAVTAAVLLLIPWVVARVWQEHSLGVLVRRYAEAPRTPMVLRTEPMQDWTLFRPRKGPRLAALIPPALDGGRFWETRCVLYAARFRARVNGHRFIVKYRSDDVVDDFSQVMRVAGTVRDGGDTWFFFPAYNIGERSAFSGIALPEECADDFRGLYRVDDRGLPALLPCVSLHEPACGGRLASAIQQPYDPGRLFTPENEWPHLSEAGAKSEQLGRLDDALFYVRAANALQPSAELAQNIAVLYEKKGALDKALERIEKQALSGGGSYADCGVLEQFLQRHPSLVSPAQVWERVARTTNAPDAWKAYGRSLARDDDQGRMAALRQLLRVAPGDMNAASDLQGLLLVQSDRLLAAGESAGAAAALREAIPFNPRNNEPILRLEKVLSKSSATDRRAVWEAAWKENPDNAHVAALCGAARAETGDLAGAREAFGSVRRLSPDGWYYQVIAGDALAVASAWTDAATAYERALALNPGLDYLRGRLDEARKRAAEQEGVAPTTTPAQ